MNTKNSRSGGAPDVSIVIPCYGKRPELQRCVRSAQQQVGLAIEIILVDDGSIEDPFSEIDTLDDQRISIIRLAKNQGASSARNNGVMAARAEYIAFLDSDDEWFPNKLALQLAEVRLVQRPDWAFCVTRTLQILPKDGRKIGPSRRLQAGERPGDYIFVRGESAQTSSFLVSRKLAIAHPFRSELNQFEDFLFFIEALEADASYAYVDQALSIYHDERANGRLSCAKSLSQCDAFERVAMPLLSKKAMQAFRARFRSRLLFQSAPAEAWRLALNAFWVGALRPRYFAGFIRAWLRAGAAR